MTYTLMVSLVGFLAVFQPAIAGNLDAILNQAAAFADDGKTVEATPGLPVQEMFRSVSIAVSDATAQWQQP